VKLLPDPATQQGQVIYDTWKLFATVALVVAIVVLGLIAYAVIRFRARPNDELPPQRGSNTTWEVIYTTIPILIVVALFVVSTRAIADVQHKVDNPDVTVEVTAYQWGWTFTYPDLGVTVTDGPDFNPTMALPVDENVRLVLRSTDVVHSFFVPDFLYKHDVIPGQTFTVDLTPTSTGTFAGHCAEFCGLDHDNMNFEVQVMTGDEFASWVTDHGGAS
jgi:cytochrome c oxidase subunit 2